MKRSPLDDSQADAYESLEASGLDVPGGSQGFLAQAPTQSDFNEAMDEFLGSSAGKRPDGEFAEVAAFAAPAGRTDGDAIGGGAARRAGVGASVPAGSISGVGNALAAVQVPMNSPPQPMLSDEG